jgi:hypothetical protein
MYDGTPRTAQLQLHDRPLPSFTQSTAFPQGHLVPVLHWDGPWLLNWFTFSVDPALFLTQPDGSRIVPSGSIESVFRAWWERPDITFHFTSGDSNVLTCNVVAVKPHRSDRVLFEWTLEPLDLETIWTLIDREYDWRRVNFGWKLF